MKPFRNLVRVLVAGVAGAVLWGLRPRPSRGGRLLDALRRAAGRDRG